MLKPPPLPAWDAVHPIAVHLPIGVLAAAPVLILLAMCFGRNNKGIAGATLILLLIGAAGCVLAVMSGEAAADAAMVPAAAEDLLDEHEELGELARNVFLGLAGFYLLILLAAAALKDRLKRAGWVGLHLVFLLAYAAGLMILMNAGHQGGRLVHEFGVRAEIRGEPVAPQDDE